MTTSLATLSRQALLARLHELVRLGNALESELLAHLGEVDARRLYLEEGFSSMFAWCQGMLRFSEAAAYRRIAAARAARRHPELLEAVRRGELHVTAISLLAPQLTRESCAELIRLARHRTVDEIRRLLADREPRPDVAPGVRRLPGRDPAARAPVAAPAASTTAPLPPPAPPARPAPTPTEPLGGERYCVRFTANAEVHAQLQELRGLLRHQVPDGDVGKILARAVAHLLKDMRKRKHGGSPVRARALPSRAQGPARPSRHIPAAIRRAVWQRDGARCTYVSPDGRRCEARELLEFHHLVPWGRERRHSVGGIALRCRAHNFYDAVQVFGEAHMSRFRNSF